MKCTMKLSKGLSLVRICKDAHKPLPLALQDSKSQTIPTGKCAYYEANEYARIKIFLFRK